MSLVKQSATLLIIIFVVLVFFQATLWDLRIQHLFFNDVTQTWVLDKRQGLSKVIFYDGARLFYFSIFVAMSVSLVGSRYSQNIASYILGIRIVLLSMIMIPICISLLKRSTGVACPRSILEFGGHIPYATVIDNLMNMDWLGSGKSCFPAGHASGGFALLSFRFFFNKQLNRDAATLIALVIGWTTGCYKMIIGDHFMSHTIISMLIAYGLVLLLTALEAKFYPSEEDN